MRSRLFARILLPVVMGAALVASPATAQFSTSYKFLEAVRKKDGETVEKALGESGTTIVNTRDVTTGDTALHIVTARRDLTWMTFLLAKGANVNARNDRGVTPLILAVSNGFVEGVQLLLGQGAQVNDPDSAGETPLISAVHQKNLELVRILLAAKADPNRSDSSGRTALDYAQQQGRDSTIATEIEASAKASKANRAQTYGPSF
jgi:ankyrin repeat protein